MEYYGSTSHRWARELAGAKNRADFRGGVLHKPSHTRIHGQRNIPRGIRGDRRTGLLVAPLVFDRYANHSRRDAYFELTGRKTTLGSTPREDLDAGIVSRSMKFVRRRRASGFFFFSS